MRLLMDQNAQRISGSRIKSVSTIFINSSSRSNIQQVASNSCATVAMLNILMNVPDIDLGDTLHTFKGATILKKPPYRGLELKNNAAIRVVHNSFVRYVIVPLHFPSTLTLSLDELRC
jgi:hypothetical protein